MSITVNGLTFFPIYWTHHDSWKYQIPLINGGFQERSHWGHQHFWMLGYQWDRSSADAFSGQMNYKFELKDIWGPQSEDKNQQFQYVVRGSPRWYFHVQEVWRRVYIQNWDEKNYNPNDPDITGRRGIKFDASQRGQSFGPFREGRDFAPYWIDAGGRTLPIEYFTNNDKLRTSRNNYIKEKFRNADGQSRFGTFNEAFFTPPVDGTTPVLNQPGGYPTFPDDLYIYPCVEYQMVTQLDWERMPGHEAKNDLDQINRFGDGWNIDVTVPFTDPNTGKYRSPFGAQPGECSPPGTYHNNLVPVNRQLKNRTADHRQPSGDNSDDKGGYDYFHRPFGLSQEKSQQPTHFHNPYPAFTDGRWVQQCLGGIVQAKAKVTIESKLNTAGPAGYEEVWVHATQYLPEDTFAGIDQGLPVDEDA